VFGREKTSTPPAGSLAERNSASERVKEGGKGRATPTRREAEQRNRRPAIGAPAPPRGATRAERKAQRAERTAAARQERQLQRVALANGDERALPARDKGPVRRYVRDYVDARYNLGEFMLPVLLLTVVVGSLGFPQARAITTLVLYVVILGMIVDGYLLRRRLIRLTTEKFGDKGTAGVGGYGLLRALQFRRARMPKPQVQRGQFPA
jgi:hypothetical protein